MNVRKPKCNMIMLILPLTLIGGCFAGDLNSFTTPVPDFGVESLSTKLDKECGINEVRFSISVCVKCGCARKRSCNKLGECPHDNKCAKEKFGIPGCIYGIITLNNEKSNPGQPSTVSCQFRVMNVSEYTQSDLNKTVWVTTDRYPDRKLFSQNITDIDVLQSSFHAEFLVPGFQTEEKFRCNYQIPDNGGVVMKQKKAVLYTLPKLSAVPELLIYDKSLHVTLPAWSSELDYGDGPINSYLLYKCHLTSSSTCLKDSQYDILYEVESGDPGRTAPISMIMSTESFEPGGIYRFASRISRIGPGGLGSLSDYSNISIPCVQPKQQITVHNNYTYSRTPDNQIMMNVWWELPSPGEDIGCNEISNITVEFRLLNDITDSVDYNLTGTIHRLYNVTLQPYSLYQLEIYYSNKAGYKSSISTYVLNRTLSVPPESPVINNIHLKTTPNTLSAAENDVYLSTGLILYVSWSDKETQKYGSSTRHTVTLIDLSDSFNSLCSAGQNKNYCLFKGLTLHHNYSIQIQARNEAGRGEKSKVHYYTAEYTVPAPVKDFTNISRSETSLSFKWTENLNTGGLSITTYSLKCLYGHSIVSYQLKSAQLKSHRKQDDGLETVYYYNVTTLQPATKYNCSIKACQMESCSEPSILREFYTLPPTAQPPPPPKLLSDLSTATTLTISLTAAESCEKYRVVVSESIQAYISSERQRRDITKRSANVDYNDSCGQCCVSASRCYITAEFNRSTLPLDFTVGDNEVYGGFKNIPLVTGREYEIWYAAGNSIDGISRFEFSRLPQNVIAQPYVDRKSGGMSKGALAGLISAIVICCLIAFILLLLIVRQKRRSLKGSSRELVSDVAEKGILIPPMSTYRRAEAVSIESLDYTKQMNGEPVYDNVKLKHFPVLMCELRDYVEQNVSDEGFKKEYNLIPWGLKFSHDEAKLADNKCKNRYGNIIAYDHSRVVLRDKNPERDTEYINANFIDGYNTPRQYIATQGPTKLTVNDFWYMVWQEKSTVIVMVTNCVEGNKLKCEQYWPDEGSIQCGDITVTLTHCKTLSHYKIRKITLEREDESRTIKQFHFTAWPDHGTPNNATPILSFLKRVRAETDKQETGAVVCHCSAGVGRSGTYIALDSLLRQAEAESMVDVYGYVSEMRKQRCNMVQTLNQYIFLHEAILEGSDGLFHSNINTTNFKSESIRIREFSHKGRSVLQEQFDKLQELGHVDICTEAMRPENSHKNRTQQSVPLNMRRIHLSNTTSNYINASWIDDHKKQSAFISTQIPLQHTVEHFWVMVDMYKPSCIVTLCDLDQFYPTNVDDVVSYGTLDVKLLSEQPADNMMNVRRHVLSVENHMTFGDDQKSFVVENYLADYWAADEDLPNDKEAFCKLVLNIERSIRDSDGPLLIICSDSSRQSGLYICSHSLLQQITTDQSIDIPDTVKLARNDQPSFIRTIEQYEYLFDFCEVLLDGMNTELPVFKCL